MRAGSSRTLSTRLTSRTPCAHLRVTRAGSSPPPPAFRSRAAARPASAAARTAATAARCPRRTAAPQRRPRGRLRRSASRARPRASPCASQSATSWSAACRRAGDPSRAGCRPSGSPRRGCGSATAPRGSTPLAAAATAAGAPVPEGFPRGRPQPAGTTHTARARGSQSAHDERDERAHFSALPCATRQRYGADGGDAAFPSPLPLLCESVSNSDHLSIL
mmetsp:Transcript_33516/g.84369  ORF Transcript_33516/g.84369 Transcript_33516/m.84369 type:complete len:220 (+) Transcript_33516:189-848(+)